MRKRLSEVTVEEIRRAFREAAARNDIEFGQVLHSFKRLTLDQIESHTANYGEPFEATCGNCGRALTAGDIIDGLFPWDDEFNLCWECEEEE